MRHRTVLCTLLGVLSVCALAQEKALITGDVEDQQDRPVAGTLLHLRNKALRVDRKTTTDSGGIFFFSDVSAADGYVMTAEAPWPKFAPESQKFVVQVGEQLQMLPPFVKQVGPRSSLSPASTRAYYAGNAGVPSGATIPMPASFHNSRARLLLTAFEETVQTPAQYPGANSQ